MNDQPAHKIETLISHLLRTGVVSSFIIILIGTVVSFTRHPDYLSSPANQSRLTQPGAAFPHTLAQVVLELRHGRGRAIVVAGLLLLIATPVMRVAVSVLAFIMEKDYPFVVFTLIVLTVLLLSFTLGKAGG